MKEYIKDIIEESLKDEVDVDREWERLFSSIEKKTISKMKTRGLFLQYLKYAAAVVLGIGVSLSTLYLTNQENLSTVGNYKLVTSKGEKSYLQLPDGTRVWLNSCTTLEYAENYGHSNRSIYLDGEAYFEVSKNSEKPFVVKLKKQEITVLGTIFNVQAYGHESYSEVTLLTGRILLEAFNERGESMSRMYLKPDQKALSDNSTGSVSLQEVNASLSNAWINGEYKFKDEPLASIVKRLENYYNVNIHLDDKRLEKIRYTGTFSLDQDILDVFRIIDYEKQFTFKRVKKDIFITSK